MYRYEWNNGSRVHKIWKSVKAQTKWAAMWQSLSSGVFKQHRRRPACASMHSDQRLCYLLIGKYHIKTCYKWKFTLLASLCSWGEWFEFPLVGNPENRFCGITAQMVDLAPQSSCIYTLEEWFFTQIWQVAKSHTLVLWSKILLHKEHYLISLNYPFIAGQRADCVCPRRDMLQHILGLR